MKTTSHVSTNFTPTIKMPKRQIENKRVIITGASSGIGRALAVELARGGARLALTARREDRLETLRKEIESTGGEAIIVPGDITDANIRAELIDRTTGELGGIDILINNAGVGASGLFEDAASDRLRQVMEVNFFSLVELTRASLPHLRAGDDPLIVNLSSIVGQRATPHNSEYSASKFAVEGFSEALRVELAQQGIGVLVVRPGTTETEFFAAALDQTSNANWPDHRPVSAEKVARQIVGAIRRRKRNITPYFLGRIMCLIQRISPSLMDRIMRRYV